jgi:diguanylate cyclase (GGDEF)-like protein
MSDPCETSRRGLRAVRMWLLPVLLVAWSAAYSQAFAACLPSADPAIHDLQVMVNRDAKAALTKVRVLLDSELGAARPDTQRIAALYDVQAQAYSILELTSDARASVAKGLQFATGDTNPIRLDLLATLAENVYDQAGIDDADKMIEAAHTLQAKGSLADTCMLIGRGLLQFREGREDLAIASLTQAYNASKGPQFAEPRILAASTLSTVLRGMGDYTQALALNKEALDWDTAQAAPLAVSVDRFLRARILTLMGKNQEAIDEFMESRRISEAFDDIQGLGFVDVRVCEARIELKELTQARGPCENALRIFTASHYADEAKDAQALLARIDLAEGHPEKALATLNLVLDKNGADLLPRRVPELYEWRSRTNAALHNYKDAYTDLAEYVSRYTINNDADRTRQGAALRARFETDREIERNQLLKRELDVSQERSERQAQQLRWNAIAAVSAVLVIALLVYFLITTLRYRQQLVRLASLDGLTGLANRRRTAELATKALTLAGENDTPLAIALIDMDHFKIINDLCGHATGDFVLKGFARVGRESIRADDVLGRWGGEEFLLIMSGATLEVALATLERLRTLTFGIHLPPSGAGLRVSLSAGVAVYDRSVRSLDELIARADAALYVAKNEGRDLVRVANETFTSSTGIRRASRGL